MDFDFDRAFRHWGGAPPQTSAERAATQVVARLAPRTRETGRPWPRLALAAVPLAAAVLAAVIMWPRASVVPLPGQPDTVAPAMEAPSSPVGRRSAAPAVRTPSAVVPSVSPAPRRVARTATGPAANPAGSVLVMPLDQKTTLYLLID